MYKHPQPDAPHAGDRLLLVRHLMNALFYETRCNNFHDVFRSNVLRRNTVGVRDKMEGDGCDSECWRYKTCLFFSSVDNSEAHTQARGPLFPGVGVFLPSCSDRCVARPHARHRERKRELARQTS